MIAAPFTLAEFERATYNLELAENAPQVRVRPRASGLGDCSRKQVYYMANVDAPRIAGGDGAAPADAGRIGGRLTPESGRYIEDLSSDVIDKLPAGLAVFPRRPTPQLELPGTAFASGHPDGELRKKTKAGNPSRVRKLDDGLVWGFEHKYLGYYPYGLIAERGFESAQPGYMAQTVTYGHELGWDAVLIIVMAQDQSAVRRFAAKGVKAGQAAGRDVDDKAHVIAIDLRPYYVTALPSLKQRAAQLSEHAAKDPAAVAREYSGTANFPCNWCDFQKRCNDDGPGTIHITPNPFGGIT